jgi:FAD/FMN-containing dehydrogenase
MKRPKGKGASYERGLPGFDDTVLATSFNGRDPGYRPNILIEANDLFDVINAVKRARRENLKIDTVSGGHSWSQNHLREGGLLLSLARINKVEVNPENETAIVGPGCWGIDLDRALKKHDLFFPIAHAPDVCMGGFLLQGGFGWGGPRLGVACQSVIGVDVVLADGSVVFADENENPDLYWAARGAGPGFFGIVMRYHLRAYPRPKFTGMKMQIFQIKHLEEVYRWADQVGPDVSKLVEFQMVMTPKALGIFSPGIEVLAPVLAPSWKEAREAVSFISNGPLRSKASITTPLMPASTALLSLVANVTHFPPDARWCTDNMWTDAPVDELLPGLHKISETMPPHPSHSLWLNWNPPATRPDMAFSLESRRYIAVYGEWKRSQDDEKYGDWATERMTEMAPHADGIQLADENLGRRPARFLKDANMTRLDQLREKFDPEGIFRAWAGRPA